MTVDTQDNQTKLTHFVDMTGHPSAQMAFKKESLNDIFINTFDKLAPAEFQLSWVAKTWLLIRTELCPLLRIWSALVLNDRNIGLTVVLNFDHPLSKLYDTVSGTIIEINDYDLDVKVSPGIIYRVRPAQVTQIEKLSAKVIPAIARVNGRVPNDLPLFF